MFYSNIYEICTKDKEIHVQISSRNQELRVIGLYSLPKTTHKR